jgi:hypothetical protein
MEVLKSNLAHVSLALRLNTASRCRQLLTTIRGINSRREAMYGLSGPLARPLERLGMRSLVGPTPAPQRGICREREKICGWFAKPWETGRDWEHSTLTHICALVVRDSAHSSDRIAQSARFVETHSFKTIGHSTWPYTLIPQILGEPTPYKYTNLKTDSHTHSTKHTHTPLSQTSKHGALLARAAEDGADFTFHKSTQHSPKYNSPTSKN